MSCETWNAHLSWLTIELLQKKTSEFIHLNCGLQIRQIWIQFDNNVREILQEKVSKTCITDLELLTMPLTNDCRNGDMIQLAHSVLSRWFSLFSDDAYFVHFLLQQSPHNAM